MQECRSFPGTTREEHQEHSALHGIVATFLPPPIARTTVGRRPMAGFRLPGVLPGGGRKPRPAAGRATPGGLRLPRMGVGTWAWGNQLVRPRLGARLGDAPGARRTRCSTGTSRARPAVPQRAPSRTTAQRGLAAEAGG